MSKTSLFILAAIFLLFFASLFIVLREAAVALAPQENSGGEVDVTVTPEVLIVGQPPRFKLEFNTHSVELDFDIAKAAEFSDDSGKINKESTWEGSPPGGHHREGTLTFVDNLAETKSVTLILRGVAGISERKFIWQI